MSGELWLQVSAGQGPAECARAVVRTVEEIRREAEAAGLEARTIDVVPGAEAGTAESALVALRGKTGLSEFAGRWRGTVQWVMRSPFRPEHKRRNWFVGVEVLEPVDETRLERKELKWETMRASGPGGQHVNRTESAVRVTHVPTGLQAVAMEERSQHSNRRLALARLARLVEELNERRAGEAKTERWRAHHGVERGNARRVFRAE
jgi:peptide chain release factor